MELKINFNELNQLKKVIQESREKYTLMHTEYSNVASKRDIEINKAKEQIVKAEADMNTAIELKDQELYQNAVTRKNFATEVLRSIESKPVEKPANLEELIRKNETLLKAQGRKVLNELNLTIIDVLTELMAAVSEVEETLTATDQIIECYNKFAGKEGSGGLRYAAKVEHDSVQNALRHIKNRTHR